MKTLTREEVAAMLRIHPDTVSAIVVTGELPAASVGRKLIFDEQDVLEYLREQIRKQTKARKEIAELHKSAPVRRKCGRRRREIAALPEGL